ncbi:MAG: 6-phosphogluconolactonase [Saprospiraceae bacterium]|nr:6-phosphogluconolactonase [Saprospiraceae bacterium]MCB9323653.1 6-phosphogluconolactonase [Lewinellaceae bacterium]
MKLHIFDSEKELITAFAEYFTDQAQKYIKSQGLFNVVLAGGSSPKRVYQLLASPDFREKIDWKKVYFFFGDERFVPADDPQNNGLMAENVLFHPLQIPHSQIFKIDTSFSPMESAEKYMETITSHFKGKPIHFDLILLGLGDNAHTASLFPFTEVLNEESPSVEAVFLKNENTFRITMTAALINQAKNTAFLVFGSNKAEAVQQVIQGIHDPENFPAQLITENNSNLHWFLDDKAAGLLEN